MHSKTSCMIDWVVVMATAGGSSERDGSGIVRADGKAVRGEATGHIHDAYFTFIRSVGVVCVEECVV